MVVVGEIVVTAKTTLEVMLEAVGVLMLVVLVLVMVDGVRMLGVAAVVVLV